MATTKQKVAIARMVENGGNASRAMREAGYSPATAKNPDKLTESTGFQELLAEYLPESLLLQKHKEGLDSYKFETQLTGKGESQIVKVPDFSTRHKYLETGYKVLGKYTDQISNNVLIVQLSDSSADRYKTPNETDTSTGNDSK